MPPEASCCSDRRQLGHEAAPSDAAHRLRARDLCRPEQKESFSEHFSFIGKKKKKKHWLIFYIKEFHLKNIITINPLKHLKKAQGFIVFQQISSLLWFVYCMLCLQQLKSAQAQFIFVSLNAAKKKCRSQLLCREIIKARFNNSVFLETVHECNIMSLTNAVLTGRFWLRH